MRLCAYCRVEQAIGDSYCSSACARLDHGVPIEAWRKPGDEGERLTRGQLERMRLRTEAKALHEWAAEWRREQAEIEAVFGDLDRCVECGRRFLPARSKKTGGRNATARKVAIKRLCMPRTGKNARPRCAPTTRSTERTGPSDGRGERHPEKPLRVPSARSGSPTSPQRTRNRWGASLPSPSRPSRPRRCESRTQRFRGHATCRTRRPSCRAGQPVERTPLPADGELSQRLRVYRGF